METIINYLDNMFAAFPKTKQIKSLRADLLCNMEDKYNELKRSGKSENEAIGIVISEFGNIDELMKEFNIELIDERKELSMLTEDEVNDYLEVSKRTSILNGVGVILCLLGATLLILIPKLIEDGFLTRLPEDIGYMAGLIPLLTLVAIATGMFIYSSMVIDKYKHLEFGFELPTHVKRTIESEYDSFYPKYTLSLIIGVVMCILSPVVLFTMSVINDISINYGVATLLLIVSVAVYIFIYFSAIQESYKKLLKIQEYSDKVTSVVATIVWTLAVIIFLISGLVFHKWYINWIVFPITALLYGMFYHAYTTIKEKN